MVGVWFGHREMWLLHLCGFVFLITVLTIIKKELTNLNNGAKTYATLLYDSLTEHCLNKDTCESY